MSQQQTVAALLKKTSHYDKDERYMATSDLCEVLKKQTANDGTVQHSLDAATERQICTAVLRLLHDKSNDVQAVAVKTLGVLLTTVQQEQVLEIADSLADQVLDASKSELRDVYAIGLRTLVKTCPTVMGSRVSQRLLGRLLEGIRSGNTVGDTDSNKEEITLACLDILTDLLARFGATAVSVTRQHEPVLQMCLQQLSAESPVVRKRAGNTLTCLSTVLSDPLLHRMVEALLRQIDMAEGVGKAGRRKTRSMQQNMEGSGQQQKGDTRSLIRTMCTVSGAVGHRLGQEQIDRILPIFLRFTEPEDAITGDDEDDIDSETGNNEQDDTDITLANELRESCFVGFESFVLRCPVEVEPHLESIITAALAYMSYDPNYSYGVSNHDEEELEDADNNDEYEDDDDEYEEEDDEEDDDDDESWKVRRAAIRALKAVVEAKKHDPSALWTVSYSVRRGQKMQVSKALVTRFKEREENCRVGVIDCFTRLLSVTVAAVKEGTSSIQFATSTDMTDAVTIDLQADYVPALVKACQSILAVKKGNDRSKSTALALLSTLCKAPGGIGGKDEISSVFKHVQGFLSADDHAMHREGTSKTLRLDALSLVHSMLASNNHNPAHIRESLYTSLLTELCQAVKEQWYKVIAEALRALAEVPRFFVLGYSDDDDEATRESERKDVAEKLYAAVEPLLSAHDVDQEIKECALKANASLLSSLHASLSAEQSARLLSLLLERLKNETTRIAAIKTMSSIAGAESGCDLSPILPESISSMASFLQLQSRSLKQSSLQALETVITNHGGSATFADGSLYSTVLQELAPLISEKDLHLSHLSLCVTVSILRVCKASGQAMKTYILEPALQLSTSALLQDHALDSLLSLFKQMVVSEAIDFQELLGLLNKKLTDNIGKHGIYNLAKCIAVITANASPDQSKKVLDDILQLLAGSNTPADSAELRQVQLSLLITGDLGRLVDLSTVADQLKAIYVDFFDSWSEELKNASSYAMGNASVGSQIFLQAIVQKLDEENKKQQYLLLSALREYIRCVSRAAATTSEKGVLESLEMIVPPLETHCSDGEEGVRTMVAECLGSLACLEPALILKKLQDMQQKHSAIVAPDGLVGEDDGESKKNANVCWTVASSVKLAIAGKIDSAQLTIYMPEFAKLLQQPEIHVRNAALLMVYSAVHHMPQVVQGLLKETIMPSLYEVAKLKMERKVDLGPFTHTVDDALPLRKASLSIFSTCLENVPGSLDITEFMPVLAKALGDAEDIQLHAHQILIGMCARQSSYVVASVDTFVEPLEKTMNKKPGQKTGTELERLNDWIKSALRVMLTLSKLEGAMNSRKFADFVERVKGNSKFTSSLNSLGEER